MCCKTWGTVARLTPGVVWELSTLWDAAEDPSGSVSRMTRGTGAGDTLGVVAGMTMGAITGGKLESSPSENTKLKSDYCKLCHVAHQ